jgi:carbonic anhydrase/acetyltransferase-like protein (isoleucine patch superfamily)
LYLEKLAATIPKDAIDVDGGRTFLMLQNEKKILIYGSREFSAVVRELTIVCGYHCAGLIDDMEEGNDILGTFEEVRISHPSSHYLMALAIGYKSLAARWLVYEKIQGAGYQLPALVHPNADLHSSVKTGDGCMVMAGALIDLNASLQPLSVVWPGAVISHDSDIGLNTFISPNATVCGFSEVGDHCFVGAGAIVTDHVVVPSNSFIPAGKVFHDRSISKEAK